MDNFKGNKRLVHGIVRSVVRRTSPQYVADPEDMEIQEEPPSIRPPASRVIRGMVVSITKRATPVLEG